MDGVFLNKDFLYRSMQAHRDAKTLQLFCQRPYDVRGMVGGRKNPVSTLHLQRTASLFKKFLYRPIVKAVNGAVQESGIADHAVEQLLGVAGVCQVASAFSRNIDFLSQLFIFLKKENLMSLLCGSDRRHHARGAAADHNHSAHVCPSLSVYNIRSSSDASLRRPPAPGSVNRESSSILSISSCMDT